jgi:ribosomal protein S27E
MAEGIVHKHLKQQGMKWIKTKVTDIVATEIKYRNMYSIADVGGINLKRKEVRIIECKASRQDFLRDKKLMDIDKSYYKHCHYFYILSPANIITVNDIPKEYGLLWLNNKDEIELIQKPVKYTGRLKTMFNTSLKNMVRAETNTLIYYFDNQENKDETNGKFSRQADIIYAAIRCSKCKHVTKDLIHKNNTSLIKCSNCKEQIIIKDTSVREITGFNKTFIEKLDKLKENT